MSPSYWGPSTWMFMHTLAAKIKDADFAEICPSLISVLIQICNNLPCPECAKHARHFWAKVKIANIRTKEDLVNLLFVFHNMVNKRKKLPPFKYENMPYYETKNVIECYNRFAKNFNTRGNMNLLNESFHRDRFMVFLKQWIMTNIRHFD